jgi:protein-S-isoprenylcysteine O-methyltransferase Ste14
MTKGHALAILFAVGWLPVLRLRAETWNAALPEYEPGERVWVVASFAILTFHFTFGCVSASAARDIALWQALASAGVFIAGMGVWLWGRRGIGPIGRRRVPSESPSEFRRDGAFALVRNPMYFGTLLASTAPIVATPKPVLVLGSLLCGLALSMRAIQDERRLHRQLGPVYAQYCREVKRLIPFIW